MDSIPRNTPALMARIDRLRNNLIKSFETLLALAPTDKTDRNTTAMNQYQMQIETQGLIKTCEDILSLTRQMQELWLFGQLKTLEQSDDTKTRIDQDAKEVGQLMAQLMALKSANGDTTGEGIKAEADPVVKGMEAMLEDDS